MRTFNEYRETTNSSVFRKLHKIRYASCSYCSWHPRTFDHSSENDQWDSYYIDFHPDEKRNYTKIPSWKLCSKNRKQWMHKPLKLVKQNWRWRHWNDDTPIYKIKW
jgi:hypothetical protein